MFESLPTTLAQFYEQVLTQSLASIKLNRYTDNFDFLRYFENAEVMSKTFDAKRHTFFLDWFFRNRQFLFGAFCNLEDVVSRRLYLHLIAFRLGGHLSVKLPITYGGHAEYEAYLKLQGGTPSALQTSGKFGGLSHFDFVHEGRRYVVDCRSLAANLFRRQYFFNRGGVEIAPREGDHVVDGGACLGDTAAVFSEFAGPTGRVYSFDPVEDHLEVLRYNATQFAAKNVTVFPCGLADTEVDAPPIRLNHYDAGFRSSSRVVPLRSIDDLVAKGEMERVDFLKLDVEGAELSVLRGASKTIGACKPRLAISLYHKPDDLFEIILFIRANFPDYQMYLDHHSIHDEETVLYCV
jgi:FkbM family methyltransferase